MNSKIISFWSARGSTGKTTLAAAFALALKKYKKDIVVADFKEVTPHVHKYFGIELRDKSNIYEAVENGSSIADAVNEHLQKKQGIWILTGFGINDFTKFEEKHFSAVLEVLKNEFEYVVIDTSAGIFFSSTYTALKNSDVIFAVTAPTVWNIEDTAQMIDFVSNRWGVEKEKFKAILNAVGKEEIDTSTAEKILEIETFSVRYGQKNILRDVGKIIEFLFKKDTEKTIDIKRAEEAKSFGVN
ncbi:Cobyrinic acid ac-diamide synthase [Thermoanaerobacter mathranii subsp. mathranii str. A3]|uniref:Cobyrinic acid ac-diamide synthase n=1 Tax=Thermoanaerobacter mathranii subsp. mathranii (strain DSM 11426 / CCUG 53645 / CIP 108742 / A3) TaxID=583358 RepID=A0ABM5LME1_THEM3|nr:Cobyrinic acid ac-diamide synthase [Thermoanaerobacter mathranii subsp. mathranii str. A3]